MLRIHAAEAMYVLAHIKELTAVFCFALVRLQHSVHEQDRVVSQHITLRSEDYQVWQQIKQRVTGFDWRCKWVLIWVAAISCET